MSRFPLCGNRSCAPRVKSKVSKAEQQRNAEVYRLHQAAELLRSFGYAEQADGTWAPPASDEVRS